MEKQLTTDEKIKLIKEVFENFLKILNGKVHHPVENSISAEHARIILRLSELNGLTMNDMLELIIIDWTANRIKEMEERIEELTKQKTNKA